MSVKKTLADHWNERVKAQPQKAFIFDGNRRRIGEVIFVKYPLNEGLEKGAQIISRGGDRSAAACGECGRSY